MESPGGTVVQQFALWVCIFCGTVDGGQMGDNMEYFGEVLGLFLLLCLFYCDIIDIHG